MYVLRKRGEENQYRAGGPTHSPCRVAASFQECLIGLYDAEFSILFWWQYYPNLIMNIFMRISSYCKY